MRDKIIYVLSVISLILAILSMVALILVCSVYSYDTIDRKIEFREAMKHYPHCENGLCW